jgi:hypothetical protein
MPDKRKNTTSRVPRAAIIAGIVALVIGGIVIIVATVLYSL